MVNVRRFFTASNPFQPSPGWKIISYLILGFWAVVVLFPLYWLLVTAFKGPPDVDGGPQFIPFVDYQPNLNAWNDMLVAPVMGAYVWKSYLNTITVGTSSAFCALALGASAAYSLTRFRFHPKLGVIGLFIICTLLAIVMVLVGVPWALAVVFMVALFILLAQTLGRRFKRALGNDDITFWLISQRMLPPIVSIIPIYILFQNLKMLDTLPALIISYTAANLPLA